MHFKEVNVRTIMTSMIATDQDEKIYFINSIFWIIDSFH